MENLVKDTAKKLNLTYKELGELIGYSESALKAACGELYLMTFEHIKALENTVKSSI